MAHRAARGRTPTYAWPSSSVIDRSRSTGFSLIEVMAAVMLLAVSMTVLLQLRNSAMASAVNARSLSIASRLSLGLLHRIEAGRVADLYDGFLGDFSDEGQPEFTYVIGLGDGSAFASGVGDRNSEMIWREAKQEEFEEQEDNDEKPELTRVFLTVTYPDAKGGEAEYGLETLVATWAVYQDFELYEELWSGNLAPEIE